MASRKRSWTREEVVLALQLYLREGVVGLGQCEPLSVELRAWPLEGHFAADPSFRNAQSVRSKLYNLQWHHSGGKRGRAHGGRETEATWAEFGDDLPRVDAAATEIRRALADAEQNGGIGDDQYESDETGVKMVAHRRRERDRGLGRRKRAQVLRRAGACGGRMADLGRAPCLRQVGGPRGLPPSGLAQRSPRRRAWRRAWFNIVSRSSEATTTQSLFQAPGAWIRSR